jgi:NTE family protein
MKQLEKLTGQAAFAEKTLAGALSRDELMGDPKIGLALGGGGARGLAHIPMLEVFDELGVKPAIIAGCSMGALIGAAYACGMTAKDMRVQAEKILGNRMGAARYVFGTRGSKIRDIFSLRGLMSLHLHGEKLVDLALPDSLVQNIEETQIPLRIIATDFERMEERVLSQGSIVKAVAASIAIPGLIVGPRIEGHIHVDGGVTNPVPFNHVRSGMDIVVAIDVTGKPKALARAHPSNMELAVGSMLIMFNQLAELRRTVSPPDIYIRPEVESFGSREFFKPREIFEAATASKDKLKRALELRLNLSSHHDRT